MNNEEIKKQKARERAKKYYQENKEKVLARQKAYVKRKYEEDENYREKCKERRKRYEENNKERVRMLKREAQKRHYHRHIEYYKNYRKEYYRTYINKDKRKIEKAIEYIKDFLCTEEYIKVDGIAIANNYIELLNILQEEDYNKVERAYLDDEWIGEDKDVKD